MFLYFNLQPAAPVDQPSPMPAVTLTVTLPAVALPQTEMTAVGLTSSVRDPEQQVKS
jgi:hypothetical protein